MQLTFWGAAQTVTGSQHLLETGQASILLDCGFFQGRRAEAYAINQHLPFAADKVDAVVLSHAHIDHAGNIPNLVKSGFTGSIFCTHATRDLAAAMLRDSGAIQEENAEYLNRHHDPDEPEVQPIYDVADAERALGAFVSFDYGRWIQVTQNARVWLSDAGHMLGSATVLVEAQGAGGVVRLCFSGDLGRKNAPILRDPAPMPEADYLILESTYGGVRHAPLANVDNELADAISTAAKRGGKVIIPAFAVGRTQELVYRLNAMVNAGRLPNVPVYVDSPLAVNVTEAFHAHRECYDDDVARILQHDPDGSAFGFKRLTYVRAKEASKALNDLRGPAVIISASGMCEHGRVLHHLMHTIEDRNNMVLFVSYQGQNTLGNRIMNGAQFVRILGEDRKVRAEVRRIEAFSGHADHDELVKWVAPQAGRLKGVFLVHGELDRMQLLADGLREAGVRAVHTPERGASFAL